MNYIGMPAGMWLLFAKSFKTNLSSALGYSKDEAARVTASAKRKYGEIIRSLPGFEKADAFKMNTVNCAMFSAFLLSMKKKPDIGPASDYYVRSMMTGAMKWYCRKSGRRTFKDEYVRKMKAAAALNAADRNPYSWNMLFLPYADGSGFEARFTKCGICALMKDLGLFEYVPAMCRLDYKMNEESGNVEFVRKYTLAGGGPYCDCGYKKKRGRKNDQNDV